MFTSACTWSNAQNATDQREEQSKEKEIKQNERRLYSVYTYVVVVKSLGPIKKSLRLTGHFKLALIKTRLVAAKGAI